MHVLRRRPRVLIITPEITALPPGMGKHAEIVGAKAGGMADVSADLVSALDAAGVDVHVALPHYRRLFRVDEQRLVNGALRDYRSKFDSTRVHFAEDRIFYYRTSVYGNGGAEAAAFALVFQREVMNHILPRVEPDLIHCHDWTTGLIPGLARRLDIPCLFTVHNIHTYEISLAQIEQSGIDTAEFWQYLYFTRQPRNYEETRDNNRIDLLASGIFAAHFVNTVSPTFLQEVVNGHHDFVPPQVREEIRHKHQAGCAVGILNAPSERFAASVDESIGEPLTAQSHHQAKPRSKRAFQKALGLDVNETAPLLYWPSRLDPAQKGCELLSHILYDTISAYWDEGLQFAFVADGPAQVWFREIRRFHGLGARIGIADFDEDLSHMGYAASDFVLMPSRFEPCGLPQMLGPMCGALPIVRDTGGLHDSVTSLDVGTGRGNGFVFLTYDPHGLRWAIDQAMVFHRLPQEVKRQQIARIMTESRTQFSRRHTAERYAELYERMLKRPLLTASERSRERDNAPSASCLQDAAYPQSGDSKRKHSMATSVTKNKGRKRVTLELQCSHGSEVFVAGTFNDWNPTAKPLGHVGSNGQVRGILMLPKGRHEYKFVVDGVWCTDPQNQECVTNDQGSLNSVLVVE